MINIRIAKNIYILVVNTATFALPPSLLVKHQSPIMEAQRLQIIKLAARKTRCFAIQPTRKSVLSVIDLLRSAALRSDRNLETLTLPPVILKIRLFDLFNGQHRGSVDLGGAAVPTEEGLLGRRCSQERRMWKREQAPQGTVARVLGENANAVPCISRGFKRRGDVGGNFPCTSR